MAMNLINEGYIPIIKKLEALKKGWDGYSAKPIRKPVLNRFRDRNNLHEWITMFKSVGFKETDILIVPTPKGTIQLEAQANDIYLEIEIKQ